MPHASNILGLETDDVPNPILPKFDRLNDEIINILLVEDIHSDALLTKIALEATNVPFSLSKIKRGDEALSRLRIDQKISPSEMPDLIMLDLGLPGMDGFAILAEIAQMPALVRSIPIVILTGHKHFEYISKTYPLCVMAYINKPCNSEEMRKVLMRVRNERHKA